MAINATAGLSVLQPQLPGCSFDQLAATSSMLRSWLYMRQRPWAPAGQRPTLPTSYSIVHCETSGFSSEKDRVTQITYTPAGATPIPQVWFLDWRLAPDEDRAVFSERVQKTADSLAGTGRAYHANLETLGTRGEAPQVVIARLIERLHADLRNHTLVVGHGLVGFAKRFLDYAQERHCTGHPIPWYQLQILDTGMVEKAAQLDIPPVPSEHEFDWQLRCGRPGSRAKYNLREHMLGKYGLERYVGGRVLPQSELYDTFLIWAVVETYREILAAGGL